MAKELKKQVGSFTHDEASRKHIPTAEFQSVMGQEQKSPIRLAYERRNRDLDPQLVWRGKDEQDWSELVVHAPPLYIQEKVHPKVLIDDLQRESEERAKGKKEYQLTMDNLFADFNGLPEGASVTDFYQHDAHWSNRMILGDSLQVMASLAEREGLRGKVQCIYLDPPYGIKFNSNFQWSTTSRDVKDGNKAHISREPEQVKAFRDTWRDGIHSYLTYLRDRLTVARDLLTESGSIFVQIGDENVHLVRSVLDEVFGSENFCSLISVVKTSSATAELLAGVADYLLWFAKKKNSIKFRDLFVMKVSGVDGSAYSRIRLSDGQKRSMTVGERSNISRVPEDCRVYRIDNLTSQRPPGDFPIDFNGRIYRPNRGYWKTGEVGMMKLKKSMRLEATDGGIYYVRYFEDFPVSSMSNIWSDTGVAGFSSDKQYIVETSAKIIQRCLLMTTDPGDLVLDPTCGSGTTAYVAEQWGRRWITIDTSRVALALARARIMGARYPYYLLADSPEGQKKESDLSRTIPVKTPTHGDLRQGFVYERVPHITLKSIANNAEIDVIWERYQEKLEPLRLQLNTLNKTTWEEWEIPREPNSKWPDSTKKLHAEWWRQRILRQQEMDASIAAKAEFEFLYDKPYEDKAKVRVAGPFTVESISPHRVLTVDAEDQLVDPALSPHQEKPDFAAAMLEQLRSAGVQQAHKENRIVFTALTGWPGRFICAEGRFLEGEKEKRAGILIGPEFGTVSRPDLVGAAREAGEAGFELLIACAFNYDAHSADFDKLGRIPVLKARMNADLHMADNLKNTGKGNLFVIFGEPDITIQEAGKGLIQVKIHGVDVFHPQTGEIHTSGPEGIACWFIDTDYNEESFFVRHAYFLGANDPYRALKTSLKAEVDAEAWASLNRDTSRPFAKPQSGRIAVKVINHLGDEVMKVFGVP
ncbi:MAG: site-specific DNA-methyltransferase [Magnetococcales bacterium]|nr:site-specific DNA-methyltransferase [Magnetococcales bacterium]MBF0114013.1 site-specific DNA-methyltransferase [Magnetococcales bacterium]